MFYSGHPTKEDLLQKIMIADEELSDDVHIDSYLFRNRNQRSGNRNRNRKNMLQLKADYDYRSVSPH